MLKIRNSVFTQKELNPEALNTLLSLESKLYDLNEEAKLLKIAIFTTQDLPFSLAKDTLTENDFNEIVAFFKAINFIDDMELERIMEQDDKLEEFVNYIVPGKTMEDVANMMKRYAFGGAAFDYFDFREKESERALDFANQSIFPIYEIADIEQRNECLEIIRTDIMAILNINAETEMYYFYMNDALCDPSNSEFSILFWVLPNAIITFKSYHRP
jgi:hypothetical protein